MTTTQKLVTWLGAPAVVVAGLVVLWGVRNAVALKAQIEQWVDSFEHSAEPVVMHIGFVPMYVDGRRVGKLRTVVVQRDRPGAVDSLHVVVEPEGAFELDRLDGCAYHLDPDAFERSGPMGIKRAVSCVSDTTGLIRFGSLEFTASGQTGPMFLAEDDLPCDHAARADTMPCTQVRDEVQRLRQEIRDEVRIHLRSNVHQMRRELHGAARGH